MTKYGMNGKKDSQLADTNYIKDGTESDTLDDPRLEKLWSKVSRVSFQEPEKEISVSSLNYCLCLLRAPRLGIE